MWEHLTALFVYLLYYMSLLYAAM